MPLLVDCSEHGPLLSWSRNAWFHRSDPKRTSGCAVRAAEGSLEPNHTWAKDPVLDLMLTWKDLGFYYGKDES